MRLRFGDSCEGWVGEWVGGVRERKELVRSKIALGGAVEKMMCLSGQKKKRKWRFAEPRGGR